jgi:hypothetical protein
MVEMAKIGRMTAHDAGPKARLEENQRRHALARWSWEPSSLPAWLNEEVYTSKILPLLKDIANPVIMSALGVSGKGLRAVDQPPSLRPSHAGQSQDSEHQVRKASFS